MVSKVGYLNTVIPSGATQEQLSMQVEIFVSGRKLKNLDVMSKSDP
jgi:hypothetical protein